MTDRHEKSTAYLAQPRNVRGALANHHGESTSKEQQKLCGIRIHVVFVTQKILGPIITKAKSSAAISPRIFRHTSELQLLVYVVVEIEAVTTSRCDFVNS
jgi:hypothetical protein